MRRHYLKYDYAYETKQAWAKLGAAIEAILARPKGAAPATVQEAVQDVAVRE